MSYAPPRDTLAFAFEHAREAAPLEACGVIAGGVYHRLENKATERDRFVMDMRGFLAVAKAHRPVEAIVHSHVDQIALPSTLDRLACEKIRLPFVIVGWPAGDVSVIEPVCFHEPLIGREWDFGRHDCFSLVRDALAEHAAIDIPDFAREWDFWKRGEDIIRAGFAEAGFVSLPPCTEPKHLDVLAFRIRSELPNHLALFLKPDTILHHAEGQRSRRDPYSLAYQRRLAGHYRHKDRR